MKVERLVHRRVGHTLREHDLLEDGDRVLIAVSGGVDSSVMARVLLEKRSRLPIGVSFVSCHVETDLVPLKEGGREWLESFFGDLGAEIIFKEVGVLSRSDQKKKMNCFFCAMQRRMALLRIAKEQGCKKIAYGHHMDDVIETLLMNMFYNAEISTMPIKLELDDHDITIIRPMAGAKEQEIKRYARKLGIRAVEGRCPYGDRGKRAVVKSLVRKLAEEDPRVRDNIAASLGRVKEGYLVQKRRKKSCGADRGGGLE